MREMKIKKIIPSIMKSEQNTEIFYYYHPRQSSLITKKFILPYVQVHQNR